MNETYHPQLAPPATACQNKAIIVKFFIISLYIHLNNLIVRFLEAQIVMNWKSLSCNYKAYCKVLKYMGNHEFLKGAWYSMKINALFLNLQMVANAEE